MFSLFIDNVTQLVSDNAEPTYPDSQIWDEFFARFGFATTYVNTLYISLLTHTHFLKT
jgi:hypothetical protein